jgi:hypothetical protein
VHLVTSPKPEDALRSDIGRTASGAHIPRLSSNDCASHLPVLWRRARPESVPETNIGQAQRFQPFLRSSNSQECNSSG